jgi:hypothetical protein
VNLKIVCVYYVSTEILVKKNMLGLLTLKGNSKECGHKNALDTGLIDASVLLHELVSVAIME